MTQECQVYPSQTRGKDSFSKWNSRALQTQAGEIFNIYKNFNLN